LEQIIGNITTSRYSQKICPQWTVGSAVENSKGILFDSLWRRVYGWYQLFR
jgi:hypothetical protein